MKKIAITLLVALTTTNALQSSIKSKIQNRAQAMDQWQWKNSNFDWSKMDTFKCQNDSSSTDNGTTPSGGGGGGGGSTDNTTQNCTCECVCPVPVVPVVPPSGSTNCSCTNNTIPPSGGDNNTCIPVVPTPSGNETNNQTCNCTPEVPVIPVVPSGNQSCNCTPVTPPSGGDNNTQNCSEVVPTPSGNETNNQTCNCTPVTPPSGGENDTNTTNCTISKVCRNTSCNDFWQWDTCGCQKAMRKHHRKRVCDATGDDTFDIDMFMSNESYYANCDCVKFMNCTPPVTPPPPSGNCSFTCEDIQQLQQSVVFLTSQHSTMSDQIDMLMTALQTLTGRVDALENSTSGGNGGLGAGSGSTADVLATINKDGLFFGDRWWVGEQFNNLYFIDTKAGSYYAMVTGKNETL